MKWSDSLIKSVGKVSVQMYIRFERANTEHYPNMLTIDMPRLHLKFSEDGEEL